MILLLLAAAVTLPFLNKPVHIDDTFVLTVTERILETPWDPFQGEIDWFGHRMPIWRATTNPPFLSYCLAPLAAVSGFDEVILHLGLVPFYALLLLGTFWLARRFTSRPWWVTAFTFLSIPVVVSGNLMRDLPATALLTAGSALFIWGSDHSRKRGFLLGGSLLGLAILTKYSAAALMAPLVLYPLLKGRGRQILWLLLPGFFLLGWAVHNLVLYGQFHPLYLLLERVSAPGITRTDKLFGGLVILGTASFLTPALLARLVVRRRLLSLGLLLIPMTGLGLWSSVYYGSAFDPEFLLWLLLGVVLLAEAVRSPFRSRDGEGLFLAVWLISTFLFSIFLVPFQAVRHLLPLMVPLTILLFRELDSPRSGLFGRRSVLPLLLLLQVSAALLVQAADYQYAATYRDFAERVRADFGGETAVWFVGHWGWKFYAERAGFRQMHRDGPRPRPGDLLLWPQRVHIGDVFRDAGDWREGLYLRRSYLYPGTVPVRTMSIEAKAGFYAVIRQRIPFRFAAEIPLENMRVYEVEFPSRE